LNSSTERLALGTVQFGLPYGVANQTGQVLRLEAKEMLELARNSGMKMLDTAKGYGDSEECLGELGSRGFDIVTKFPVTLDGCTDIGGLIQAEVEDSCARLKVGKIYGLLLHHSASLLGSNGKELVRALEDMKHKGLVEKVGISIYSPDELELVYQSFFPDIVQAPFNLIDRSLHTSGWMDRLKERGVEIHIRSVFLQGLLLMDREDIPSKFEPWQELWNTWHEWLKERDRSALQICLAFALHFPEIDRILVGADCSSQLQEIIDGAKAGYTGDFPEIESDDQSLINPSLWNEQ